MTSTGQLDALIKKGNITQQEAFRFFDSCECIKSESLFGIWRGYGINTGHPMDGMLTAARWYGKKIIDEENVHPLLFPKFFGGYYAANPGLMPLEQFQDVSRTLIRIFFPFVGLFIRTCKPRARLRNLEYRGKLSAAMIYDQKPILDMFRKIDENTVLGVTDFKWDHDLGCFFLLVRDESPQKGN